MFSSIGGACDAELKMLTDVLIQMQRGIHLTAERLHREFTLITPDENGSVKRPF